MVSRVGAYFKRHHLALLCLFLVVAGGTAYALERNSVKSKHIVNGQVKAPDLAPDAAQAPVAFAQVDPADNEITDLDPSRTRGIDGLSHETNSFYCFDLTTEAKVGVASPTYDGGARFPRVQVPGNGFCPEGKRDASVVFASTLENSVDQGFSIIFVR